MYPSLISHSIFHLSVKALALSVRKFRYVIHLTIFAFLLSFYSSAFALDWIQIYEHSNEDGKSYRFYLPAPGVNSTSVPSRVGSLRLTGLQLRSKKFSTGESIYKFASSFRVWAQQNAITLYLFENDDFTGNFIRFHVPKGYTNVISSAGWFNDKMGSLIAVHEKIGQQAIELLMDTPIPLDTMPNEIRVAFGAKLAGVSEVEEFWLGDTQVGYATPYSFRRRHGHGLPPQIEYEDSLRISQDITIDPDGWAFDYDTNVELGFGLRTKNEELHFAWQWWRVWVEGGLITNRILEPLSKIVSSSIVQTAEEIRDAIRDEVYSAHPLGALAWSNVSKVGFTVPCDNFNSLSRTFFTLPYPPAKPYCWAKGSHLEMFPPTLILHHDPSDP